MTGGRKGFTLIEIMVAVTVVLLASAMTYVTFATVTRAWRRGSKLAEDLHYGDFVMDQLALGLRSAYFPDSGPGVKGYGFWLEDGGTGPAAADSISWVKQGPALSDSNSPVIGGPHRVQFAIREDERRTPAPAVRFWRPFGNTAEFDPAQLPFQFLPSRVRGFDCRIATNTAFDGWDWSDTWEKDDTNRLPRAVELTLYLEPLEKDGEPVEMKRCVEIPVWRLSRR